MYTHCLNDKIYTVRIFAHKLETVILCNKNIKKDILFISIRMIYNIYARKSYLIVNNLKKHNLLSFSKVVYTICDCLYNHGCKNENG